MATMKVKRKRLDQIRPKLTLHFDYWLLLAVAGLIIIGLLTVYSTTFDIGLRWKGNSTYYIERQFMALLLGLAGFVFVMSFDYHFFRRFSVIIFVVSLLRCDCHPDIWRVIPGCAARAFRWFLPAGRGCQAGYNPLHRALVIEQR